MKLILIGDELNQSRHIEFQSSWLKIAGIALLTCIFIVMIIVGWALHTSDRVSEAERALSELQQRLLFEQNSINHFYTYADQVFVEHAKQAGIAQARIARLEALGGQLADMADFSDEFDFYSEPALGGPETINDTETGLSISHVLDQYQQLNQTLAVREQDLKALHSLLDSEQLQKEQYLAGKPVQKGWLSSPFGRRVDPFHGRVRWHKGVDYAGKMGANVVAVASGIVVWSGDRYGFGDMVEINHGNGYSTRYAHNSVNHVATGDVVKKGQVVAAMGSSGRSTGPHVHFEVIKNGKAVNPERYIYRKTL